MNDKRSALKRVIALLCVIFIFVYISVFYFTHTHTCINAGCAICAWIESSRNALDALLSLVAFMLILNALRRIAYDDLHVTITPHSTPIQLKVKLSD